MATPEALALKNERNQEEILAGLKSLQSDVNRLIDSVSRLQAEIAILKAGDKPAGRK